MHERGREREGKSLSREYQCFSLPDTQKSFYIVNIIIAITVEIILAVEWNTFRKVNVIELV